MPARDKKEMLTPSSRWNLRLAVSTPLLTLPRYPAPMTPDQPAVQIDPPPFDPSTGLIEGFVCDGAGGARPLPASELAHGLPRTPPGGYVWLHFQLQPARDWLPDHVDLDEQALRALLAEETRPRCSRYGKGLLMNLRGVNLNEGHQPEEMVSLRILLRANLLLTVRRQRLVAVERARNDCREGHAPELPAVLLLHLASGLNDRIEPIVDALADRADDFEELLVTKPGVDLRGRLAAMRHDAIVFRRYVAPQREALTRFAANEAGLLPDEALVLAREEADRTTRMVEELDSTRERAGVLDDQLAARRSDEMNRNMMVLSVVSAVFLPLGFLTGLLGINVGGMPGSDDPSAFWFVAGLCAGLGAVLFALFLRMGWLPKR